MVGSPRFEEAREACGCLLEDLRPSVMQGQSQKNLGQEVVQQLADRKEKRRMYELQTVLLERKRLIEVEVETKTGDTVDWAAKMKEENLGRIALLQEAAVKAKEVEKRRTCFELAKSLAIETRAQQMVGENIRREERAKEIERQRIAEVQKQQLERKGRRMEMESAKLRALRVQEEEMVRKLYSYKQMEEVREEIKRRKAEEREKQARLREVQRLEAQREHQAVAAAQLEEHRQSTLRVFETKEARLQKWQASEARRHAELLRQSRDSEKGVGKRLQMAFINLAEKQLTDAEKALERRRAGDQRNARLEAEKTRAIELKRRQMAAKHDRQTTALRSIRMVEEEHKDELKKLGAKQQAFLEEQQRHVQQKHEQLRFLAAEREAEKKNCVERTVRATEHLLQQRVARHMEMEGRASGLQAERRAMIEERSRSAKALALQRTVVQEQFKKARSMGDLNKSKDMLAQMGIDVEQLKEMSESIMNASGTSIAAPNQKSTTSMGGARARRTLSTSASASRPYSAAALSCSSSLSPLSPCNSSCNSSCMPRPAWGEGSGRGGGRGGARGWLPKGAAEGCPSPSLTAKSCAPSLFAADGISWSPPRPDTAPGRLPRVKTPGMDSPADGQRAPRT